MGYSLLPVYVVLLAILIVTVKPEEDPENLKISTCELDLAELLLLPSKSMQVQALKQELFRYLEDKLEEDEHAKRPLNSIVGDSKFRNRLSGYSSNDDKRSIANLAKNGQLPIFQRQEANQDKRSIESLARTGQLPSKRELDNFDIYEKRNVASLARGYNLPSGKRYYDLDTDNEYDKRNIASIVRNSGKRLIQDYPYELEEPYLNNLYNDFKRNLASVARSMGSRYAGKRNVAALLRQDSYLNGGLKSDDVLVPTKSEDPLSDNEMDKRNIASLKAQMKGERKFKRDKRQVDYSWQPNEEYPVPVYQNNNVYDYEELMRALTGQYPNTEKRFLGRIPQMGRPKTTPQSKTFH